MAKKKDRKKKSSSKLVPTLVLSLFALLVLPTTLIIGVGCLPSFVAYYIDRTPKKSLAVSVFSLNLAAAFYFLLRLWFSGNDINTSLSLLSDPVTIIVMYSGAIIGYGIDIVIGGAATEVMYLKAKKRKASIEEEQAHLIQRWSKDVSKQDG